MYDFTDFKTQLQNVSAWLRKEYSQISAGRAHPGLLDNVRIESYGSEQPIKNLATITLEDVRTLRIVPWDKSMIQKIEKAIRISTLPLAVGVDSEGVRASVPQVTEENKRQLVKLAKEKLEEARIRVRNERNTTNKDIDTSELSDDEKAKARDLLQKNVDEMNTELEEVFKNKENDIMTV